MRGIHRLIPLQKTSYADFWYFLCCKNGKAVEKTINLPMIWDGVTLMLRHCNGTPTGLNMYCVMIVPDLVSHTFLTTLLTKSGRYKSTSYRGLLPAYNESPAQQHWLFSLSNSIELLRKPWSAMCTIWITLAIQYFCHGIHRLVVPLNWVLPSAIRHYRVGILLRIHEFNPERQTVPWLSDFIISVC